MIKTLLTLALSAICLSVHAQYISPTDLFQMNKLWQDNDPHCDKNTYDYLLTVDANWIPHGQPTVDDKGYSSLIGYSLDHKTWYLPTEYVIMLAVERGTVKKSLTYTFRELDTWNKYNQQMQAMNAIRIGGGASGGGQQTIYQVNDVIVSLTEFPPGINGDDKTYQVALLHANQ